MNVACPRMVIAGTGSGVGKTSLALGLVRALAQRGLRVQAFKVGPDFLDPTYLALASGRPCYNLDGWMTSGAYVQRLFARATADADVAVIEGVMGLYDGSSPTTLEGSTAEIAAWLDAPVVLVANAHGQARSLAATVQGFARFEPRVRLAGVVANQTGTPGHGHWLREALAAADLPPLLGAISRGALPTLSSRHLGLVTADLSVLPLEILDQLSAAVEQSLDVAQLLELARQAPQRVVDESPAPTPPVRGAARIGIAQDDAFHFYYADNLQSLQACGAELVPFSPLADHGLPAGLDALYFGGGYPEVHAEWLAENAGMLDDVRQFAAAGLPIYAECGGLIYLGRTLLNQQGHRFPLAAVLPLDTTIHQTKKTLRYADVTLLSDTLWGAAGSTYRGHEFHYSQIAADDTSQDGWRRAYTVHRRGESTPEGFARGQILASYVHLHWAARPDAIPHFLAHCGTSS